ncbi:TPA: putative DNA-binding domain-containing protein [Legionella pneumophila]|uniref:HvfC/BufC N-terminal domain-containing protein n=1 Tax=Legionella pneumophila TaxID=446 RepID=UPI0005C432DF|nr:DNA-binding domain-containing protein [Legionella pneumophila]MCK1871596.1 DNA-binding domain-containing protein [Legionella pneumophila]MDI2080787.1 DNA-binding domain-containing protein [Legionella pneumophila]MDR9845737.1 DNA-binding domain-containing protein [Legionella pneumophila]MDW8988036.1 DNA-binding domain-containing protein [Legionella pneumophila]MDW8993456.1 DNA-binding domain-containing protein [Legionella pneumophila]
MPRMKQIQEFFLNTVLNQQDTAIFKYFCPNEITNEFRFDIYRNTILQNLRHSLEMTFPAIWKLIGKGCADGLALHFIQDKNNLPTTNCLDDWGEKFPLFLKNNPTVSHLLYLKDIAEIEWLKHLSYCSRDCLVFEPQKLQKHLNDRVEKLILLFNPSVFLYSSSYYLKSIFDLIEHPTETGSIDFQQIPSYAVISRQKNQTVIHWITHDLFHFLCHIKAGASLGFAYENTLENNPDFDLLTALQFLLRNELLEDSFIHSNYHLTHTNNCPE